MVRSFPVADPATAPFPNLRLQLNEVSGFEEAMICLLRCCEAELATRTRNARVTLPCSLIATAETLKQHAEAALEIYRTERDAFEASFVAELLAMNNSVMAALAHALANRDYSDLVC